MQQHKELKKHINIKNYENYKRTYILLHIQNNS